MPLVLTPEFRTRMEEQLKLRLQPPGSIADMRQWDRRIAGLPGDVLFTLENIRLLADQGNRVAARLWESECKRLGIWYDRKMYGP